MKMWKQLALVSMLMTSGISIAGDTDPLFVNLTTNESHRALMGITFGKGQLERGHPLTVFLNDKGVFIASKQNATEFSEQQKMLGELMAKGAIVLICQMCMKHYGVTAEDLLPGVKLSSPDISGAALFKEDSKTLSW